MAIPPQKFREIVFQILYSKSFSLPEKELSAMLMKELKVSKKAVTLALEKASKVEEHSPEIDRMIETFSEGYSFERISNVEKTILRLCAFELIHLDDIPKEVVFAEAARLTKKFSSDGSAQFVNAILDRFLRESICS